jgi:hypothetical protein
MIMIARTYALQALEECNRHIYLAGKAYEIDALHWEEWRE